LGGAKWDRNSDKEDIGGKKEKNDQIIKEVGRLIGGKTRRALTRFSGRKARRRFKREVCGNRRVWGKMKENTRERGKSLMKDRGSHLTRGVVESFNWKVLNRKVSFLETSLWLLGGKVGKKRRVEKRKECDKKT